MTVTDTVTSFAHDAAHAAEDLGKQALQLGRTAVATGSDVASSAAAHASHLVHDVAKDVKKRVPTVRVQKKRSTPWKLWLGVGVLAIVVAMAARKKRAQATSAHTPTSAHSSGGGSRPDLRSTTSPSPAQSSEAAAS